MTLVAVRPPVGVLPKPELFRDEFERADYPTGNGWTDQHDTSPSRYDASRIVSRSVSLTSSTRSTVTGTTNFFVGHSTIWRRLGVTDNVEVGLTWNTPTQLSTLHQVSPIAFYDPNSSDSFALGLAPVWDVSVSAGYLECEPASPSIATVFDTSYYKILNSDGVMRLSTDPLSASSTAHMDAPTYGTGVTHDVVLRCAAGQVSMWWDGTRVIGPYPVPATFQGRDGWGLHIVSIHIDGSPTAATVDRWWARPCSSHN